MSRRFKFTAEQEEGLRAWKQSLNSERAVEWAEREKEAAVYTGQVLNNPDFQAGRDLSPDEFSELFKYMVYFAGNLNLNYHLFTKRNSISDFNRGLRSLLHGGDSFPERVNDFFKLKAIGIQTLSQFLVAANPEKYPLVSGITKDLLALSSAQDEAALADAKDEFEIRNPEKYLDRTIDYLRDFIIFRAIKEFLGLRLYTEVNNLLWFQAKRESDLVSDEIEKEGEFGSISLEGDLRDYLADRVSLIEKGLTLVGKEYYAEEAGRIDLLCRDREGNHIVIELKKGKVGYSVVGQTLNYMGWVQKKFGGKTRGIIIVNEPDPNLSFAVSAVGDKISLKYYKVNFEINDKY